MRAEKEGGDPCSRAVARTGVCGVPLRASACPRRVVPPLWSLGFLIGQDGFDKGENLKSLVCPISGTNQNTVFNMVQITVSGLYRGVKREPYGGESDSTQDLAGSSADFPPKEGEEASLSDCCYIWGVPRTRGRGILGVRTRDCGTRSAVRRCSGGLCSLLRICM